MLAEIGEQITRELADIVAITMVVDSGRDDVVGRISGDEFVVLLAGVCSHQDAELVANKIISAVGDPVPVVDTIVRPGSRSASEWPDKRTKQGASWHSRTKRCTRRSAVRGGAGRGGSAKLGAAHERPEPEALRR